MRVDRLPHDMTCRMPNPAGGIDVGIGGEPATAVAAAGSAGTVSELQLPPVNAGAKGGVWEGQRPLLGRNVAGPASNGRSAVTPLILMTDD